MSEKNVVVSGGGLGLFSTLGVVFIILKLVGVIDWSWWWVTAPFWGGFALVLAILLIAFGIAFIMVGVQTLIQKFKK